MSQQDDVFQLDEEAPEEHRITNVVREHAHDFSKLSGAKQEELVPERRDDELPPNI